MKQQSFLRSALLLTVANLCLRVVSMLFQIYLTRRVGAAGIGLLQLTMTVGMLAVTLGNSGVRVASMYLLSEERGLRRRGGMRAVMRACLGYALAISTLAALALWCAAPWLAGVWLENAGARPGLRAFALFLPATCLVSVLSGYFTACGKVGRLVAVECGERVLSIFLTVLLLARAGQEIAGCCTAIILGGSLSGVGSLLVLGAMYGRDARHMQPAGGVQPVRRLLKLCIPLALSEYLRSLLGTLEHLLIPRGLERSGSSYESSLAAYGTIHGMVFPVITFPTAVLYAIADLLVPELARSHAAGRQTRMRLLSLRSLRLGLIFSAASTGVLFACANPLGQLLFRSAEAGRFIRIFAPLVPMLYMDTIVDAGLKGLGEQVASVRYNTITSTLDVVLLLLLLPKFGIGGYFFCFTVTHGVNFLLSVRRFCSSSGVAFPVRSFCRMLLTAGLPCLAACLLTPGWLPLWPQLGLRAGVFFALFFLLLPLGGREMDEDLHWLRGRIRPHSPT